MDDPDSAFLRRGGFNDSGWGEVEDKRLSDLVIEFKAGDEKKAVRWAKIAKKLGNERDPVLVRMRYYTHIKSREAPSSYSTDDMQSDGNEDHTSRRRRRSRPAPTFSPVSPISSSPSTPRHPSSHMSDDAESTTSADTTPAHSLERSSDFMSYPFEYSDVDLDPSVAGYNYYNTLYPSVNNWELGPFAHYPREAFFGTTWNLQ